MILKKKKKKYMDIGKFALNTCGVQSSNSELSSPTQTFSASLVISPRFGNTALMVENLGVFSLNVFESPKLHLRKWSTSVSVKIIKLSEGITFVLVATERKNSEPAFLSSSSF